MPKKNFLLLSLEDTKIKKVSNVISNDSCRKILDYLANKEATETEIAQTLQLPISTVHYNLQQLMETGLVSADEFHYSQKGKEVSHYKLANKYIVIAPKSTYGIKEKLKSILPILLIASGAALALQYTQRFFATGSITRIFTSTRQTLVRETLMAPASEAAADTAQQLAKSAAEDSAQGALSIQSAAQELINKTSEYALPPETTTSAITMPASIWSNIALWFFIGALFALAVYFIINLYRKDLE